MIKPPSTASMVLASPLIQAITPGQLGGFMDFIGRVTGLLIKTATPCIIPSNPGDISSLPFPAGTIVLVDTKLRNLEVQLEIFCLRIGFN